MWVFRRFNRNVAAINRSTAVRKSPYSFIVLNNMLSVGKDTYFCKRFSAMASHTIHMNNFTNCWCTYAEQIPNSSLLGRRSQKINSNGNLLVSINWDSHLALNADRVLCKDSQRIFVPFWSFLAIVDHCMFLTHLPTKQKIFLPTNFSRSIAIVNHAHK